MYGVRNECTENRCQGFLAERNCASIPPTRRRHRQIMANMNVAPTCWLRPSASAPCDWMEGMASSSRPSHEERKISGHIGAQNFLSILVCLYVGMCRFSCAIAIHYWKSNFLEPHLPLATSRQASPYCPFSPYRWLLARRSRLLAQEYIGTGYIENQCTCIT